MSVFLPNEQGWLDPTGQRYLINMIPGQIKAGGSVAIENVIPGGGVQPVGTTLTIRGSGFTASMPVAADGLRFSSVEVVSSNEIRATLATSAEITGVPFRIGTETFFPAMASASTNGSHAILPNRTLGFAKTGYTSRGIRLLIQNPHAFPLHVRIVGLEFNLPVPAIEVDIPPGELYTKSIGSQESFYVYPDQPARMGALVNMMITDIASIGSCTSDCTPPALISIPSPSSVQFDYQTGTTAPPSRQIRVTYARGTSGVTVEALGAAWLHVSETKMDGRSDLTVTANPAGLAAGTYEAAIKITPVVPPSLAEFPAQTSTIPVTLRVSTEPTIYTEPIGTPSSAPRSERILSNGTPAAFTIATTTESGGNWLSTNIQSGTTPAMLEILTDTEDLTDGNYRGTVTIHGPRNIVEESVFVRVGQGPPPSHQPFSVNPPSSTFTLEQGTALIPTTGLINFQNAAPDFQAEVENQAETPWLSILVFGATGNTRSVNFYVDKNGLAPGTYTGTIAAKSGDEVVRSIVTVTILPTPVQRPVVDVTSLSFATPAGTTSEPQRVTILTATGGLEFVSVTTKLGAPIAIREPSPGAGQYGSLAPRIVEIAAAGSRPGSYEDELIVANSAGEVRIPLHVYVTASSTALPVIGSIVNGASQLRGPIVPGEIIAIHGMAVGPAPVGLQLDAQGRALTTAPGDAKVLINDIPAPIVYGSVNQWNVSVPYEIEGEESATIRVQVGDAASEPWVVPVALSDPAIWTATGSGIGPAAALNQNDTVNSSANPAPRGTAITFFVNGQGQTEPASVTGSVNEAAGMLPRLPVSVTIGGRDATVLYAGAAPSLLAGVMQVNVLIPPDAPVGDAVARIKVGDAGSLATVTIAIECADTVCRGFTPGTH